MKQEYCHASANCDAGINKQPSLPVTRPRTHAPGVWLTCGVAPPPPLVSFVPLTMPVSELKLNGVVALASRAARLERFAKLKGPPLPLVPAACAELLLPA